MNIVVFGLTVSSSWGNGHATVWRALLRALGARGHHVTFFEKDVAYYAQHRDLTDLGTHALILYEDWNGALPAARETLASADAAIITSYCPDAEGACELILDSDVGVRVFYDLDSPVTLEALRKGDTVDYLPAQDLSAFDLVLSFGGGPALHELRQRLGARRVEPLYGSVDPDTYRRTTETTSYRSDVTYLGTYARDRQDALDRLFLEPARRRPALRFLLGGSLYPQDFPWSPNLHYIPHVPPPEHPKFYSGCRLTVSVTRGPMAQNGFCPSGRLFEAAACGTPVLSDPWPGIDTFFEPGREILIAQTADEAIDALDRSVHELTAIGERARARALACHSADRRAQELEQLLVSM